MKDQLSVRLLGEFFVVVLGILGAFAIDDWNSDRNDRVLEREYLAELAADLEADGRELDVNRGSAIRRAVHAGRILTSAGFPPLPLQAPRPDVPLDLSDTLKVAVCGAVMVCVSDYRVFDGSRAAYESLLASGNLRVLRNREVVRGLAVYYATAASEKDGDVAIGRPIVNALGQALNRKGFAVFGATPETQDELVSAVKRDSELRALFLQVRGMAMWQVMRIEVNHRPALGAILTDVRMELDRINR